MNVFIGSLMLVPYNFAPTGWAFCQGQLLAISSNTALFSLLGTTYGGDGKSTFGLPDLRGSLAISAGQGQGLGLYNLGEAGGSQTVQLNSNQVPPHSHPFMATDSAANSASPTSSALAKPGTNDMLYSSATSPLASMNAAMVQPAGSGQPHNNMMPYLALNWIIALQGIFPSRP